jgi:hypothetical protein
VQKLTRPNPYADVEGDLIGITVAGIADLRSQCPRVLCDGAPLRESRRDAASSTERAPDRSAQKGPAMASTPAPESKAAARLRLTEEMLDLGHKIDRQEGPERLEMLRQQATLSDKREALSSKRH